MFKVIDTEPLNVDNDEHLRLLAYRSVMQNLHTNVEQGNRLWHLHNELAKAAGQDPCKVFTPALVCALEFYNKAQNSFQYRSEHFDRPIEKGKKPDLKHSALELRNQAPVLAVSCLFSTSHSEQGHIIGPTLNIAPLDENGRAVAAITCALAQRVEVDDKARCLRAPNAAVRLPRRLSRFRAYAITSPSRAPLASFTTRSTTLACPSAA